MSRPATFLAVLAIVCATLAIRPAHAAPVPSGKRVAVFIWLKGAPLGADQHFRARTARTHNHYLLDPALPAARWYSSRMLTYHKQEVAYLQSHHVDVQVVRYFSILFNGISATVPASQMGLLRRAVNVTQVTKQQVYKPMLDKSIGLIHAQEAWPVVGGEANAGKGVFIAQIDTGIDITNPCFSDKGMPPPPSFLRGRGDPKFENNKVIVARAYPVNPGDNPSPADTAGHGTFGAAIEACDYNTKTPVGTEVSGVAPAAYLMNYNVFPSYPNTESPSLDTFLPALEDAISDGADVVNYSAGYSFGADDYRLDPDEQAIEVAARNGVSVVVAAGNAGPESQSVSSPSAAPDAISAGATTNSHALHTTVKVGGPTAPPDSLSLIQDAPSVYRFSSPVGPAQIVPAGYGRMTGDTLPPGEPANSNQVNDFAGKDFKGKIALVERGKRYFKDMIANAKKAGAAGVIVYDSNPAGFELQEMPNDSNFPAVFVSYKDGTALAQWVTDHPDATATLDPTISFFSQSPDLLTDFSSRGYGPNYLIKPDVVAPGQAIYSAAESEYPPDNKNVNVGDVYDPSGFTTADGTSFAAPHTTGTVALLKGLHPTWTPAMLKSTIQGTAQMNIHEQADPSKVSSVMESGSGLIDAEAAVDANAYLLPSAVSFGAVNRGYGAVQQTSHVSLHDANGGAGTWQGSVSWIDGGSGVSLTVPSSLTLAANGTSDIPLQLNVSASAAAGDYDGYAVFTKGGETLHVSFMVHVATVPVKQGSVLLVDDTWSRFQAPYPMPPIKHVDVSKYYTDAVAKIGKSSTYWPENTQGTPSLSDMKRASAVVYFTGANLNDFSSENGNVEGLDGPITPTDSSILDQYLQSGGHVFVTGEASVLSVPLFMYVVLGVNTDLFSLYDTDTNDFAHTGTVSPPKPSTHPDSGVGAYKRVGPFLGLKPIDLSSKGDGARTNLAQFNTLLGDFVGVAGLQPVHGNVAGYGTAYGQWGMAAPKQVIPAKAGLQETGVTASNEPTLSNPTPKYKGRSVVFSFGFEGINDNTGFATRAQVLKRILQWFNDKPAASVAPVHYPHGKSVPLRAGLKSNVGARIGAYQWQIGSRTLGATAAPTKYRFPHAGTYRARVLVTDTMGHASLSRWVKLHVR